MSSLPGSGWGAYAQAKNNSARLCAKNAGGAYACGEGGVYLWDITLTISFSFPHVTQSEYSPRKSIPVWELTDRHSAVESIHFRQSMRGPCASTVVLLYHGVCSCVNRHCTNKITCSRLPYLLSDWRVHVAITDDYLVYSILWFMQTTKMLLEIHCIIK